MILNLNILVGLIIEMVFVINRMGINSKDYWYFVNFIFFYSML